MISGAGVRILDPCQTDTALNVTLRALLAVAHSIIPQRFGPCIMDDRVVREPFASYAMAMLDTLHDTPTCPPVDDGSTDPQLDRSCSLGSRRFAFGCIHWNEIFLVQKTAGGNQKHPSMGNRVSDTLRDISNGTGGEHGHCSNSPRLRRARPSHCRVAALGGCPARAAVARRRLCSQ